MAPLYKVQEKLKKYHIIYYVRVLENKHESNKNTETVAQTFFFFFGKKI